MKHLTISLLNLFWVTNLFAMYDMDPRSVYSSNCIANYDQLSEFDKNYIGMTLAGKAIGHFEKNESQIQDNTGYNVSADWSCNTNGVPGRRLYVTIDGVKTNKGNSYSTKCIIGFDDFTEERKEAEYNAVKSKSILHKMRQGILYETKTQIETDLYSCTEKDKGGRRIFVHLTEKIEVPVPEDEPAVADSFEKAYAGPNLESADDAKSIGVQDAN